MTLTDLCTEIDTDLGSDCVPLAAIAKLMECAKVLELTVGMFSNLNLDKVFLDPDDVVHHCKGASRRVREILNAE